MWVDTKNYSSPHMSSVIQVLIWGWINTNYHQKWVGEHPHG